MIKPFLTICGSALCISSTTSFAQFLPADLKEMEAKIGTVKENVPPLVPQASFSPVDLKSANGTCEAAQQSFSKGIPIALSLTDLSSLLESAGEHLLRDAKDQFETIAQYDARQIARRNAWIENNRFFVLPVSLASGANVYNAETQIYTLDAAGRGVSLKQQSRYIPSGFDNVLFPENIQALQGSMNQVSAKNFYENRGAYKLIYVATPIPPYAQKNSSYSSNYTLLASSACRFVWRVSDARVMYFAKP